MWNLRIREVSNIPQVTQLPKLCFPLVYTTFNRLPSAAPMTPELSAYFWKTNQLQNSVSWYVNSYLLCKMKILITVPLSLQKVGRAPNESGLGRLLWKINQYRLWWPRMYFVVIVTIAVGRFLAILVSIWQQPVTWKYFSFCWAN